MDVCQTWEVLFRKMNLLIQVENIPCPQQANIIRVADDFVKFDSYNVPIMSFSVKSTKLHTVVFLLTWLPLAVKKAGTVAGSYNKLSLFGENLPIIELQPTITHAQLAHLQRIITASDNLSYNKIHCIHWQT